MLIYEKMKDRYNGEQTDTVMEKPLTAATVKGPKGEETKRCFRLACYHTRHPGATPALGGEDRRLGLPDCADHRRNRQHGRGNAAYHPRLQPRRRRRTGSTHGKQSGGARMTEKKKLTQLGRAFLLIETLAPHVVTGLSVTDLSVATGISAPNVCRDMDALAAEDMAQKLESGRWALTARPAQGLPGLRHSPPQPAAAARRF